MIRYIIVYTYYTFMYIYIYWFIDFEVHHFQQTVQSNMATVAQVIVQATGNALTKAVTAAEVGLLKHLR